MIVRQLPLGLPSYPGWPGICHRCLRQVTRPATTPVRRTFVAKARKSAAVSATTLRIGYFLNNTHLRAVAPSPLERAASTEATIPPLQALTAAPAPSFAVNTVSTSSTKDLPHRRRQRARHDARPTTTPAVELPLPPDMPSALTTIASTLPVHSLRRYLSTILALSKPRLSMLIVLTTTSAYSLYPVPEMLAPTTTDTPSLSALTLLFLTVGTSLTCASANTLNMLYEPKWDAMMSRTKNRPLVRGLITSRGALLFATLSGGLGVLALYYGVNPTVAFLGGFNIFLYAGAYTPLKRLSPINTWVGALVGGIPPLMGWAAAAGQNATGTGTWQDLLLGEQNVGGWLLAGLLLAWQFPHFMALSWPIREEYRAAGYKMLCWTNPARNGRVALRYSLLFIPICFGLSYTGVTEWSFVAASLPVNAWIVREAWRFYRLEGYKGSARGLFWASVWHLPVVMVLAMVEKKGMWQRAWRALVGDPDLDADTWTELDDSEEDEDDDE